MDTKTTTPGMPDVTKKQRVYIDEVQGHQKRYKQLLRFTASSTRAAFAMLLAAVVAIIIANTGGYGPFLEFWHTEITLGFGVHTVHMSLAHIINDILMAIFFLLVGLEIKYEMTVGELTNIRQALLPILAACGGVFVPIIIYALFNAGHQETAHGWGVPTATDIAFALGIISLLGNRIPSGVRVFLSTLAVADDIIAIIVIAVFYGQSPSMFWLGCAGVVLVVLILMNRRHVFSLKLYLLVGVVLWVCVFLSGIHSTIAGVLLAFTIPTGSRVNLRGFVSWSGSRLREANDIFDENLHVMGQTDYLKTVGALSRASKQVIPPATRLEHDLYPWVYFGILPLFALTNADVSIVGGDMAAMLHSPAMWGVFFGLLLGKPLGIMLFSFFTVKSKVASLPANVNWTHMLGAAILGGVGFTMAIFVANLAFESEMLISSAKLGILMATVVAGLAGFSLLALQARRDKKKGVAYLQTEGEAAFLQTAGSEAARHSKELIEGLNSALLEHEIAAAEKEKRTVEIVVDVCVDGELIETDEATAARWKAQKAAAEARAAMIAAEEAEAEAQAAQEAAKKAAEAADELLQRIIEKAE